MLLKGEKRVYWHSYEREWQGSMDTYIGLEQLNQTNARAEKRQKPPSTSSFGARDGMHIEHKC